MPYHYLFWIVPLVIIVGIFTYITRKIRYFSRALFGTESLIEGLRQEKLSLSRTPRSLNSMEPIYLPMIRKDFPGLNIEELKRKAERVLQSSLQAISAQKIDMLSAEVPHDIRQRVVTEIGDLREQGLTQHYDQIKLHRTVVSDYHKGEGLVRLTMQTAMETFAWLERDGKVLSGDSEYRSQLVFASQYLYVQDESQVKDRTALGLTCPQCGAPITSLGTKICSYCSSTVQEVNLHVWRLTDYRIV